MTADKIQGVILAGGQGTRFWPISRLKRPKQFLSISSDGESLISATARRLVPIVGKDNLVIVTNSMHQELVQQHVPNARIISEPIGRNTAPSIGLAALMISRTAPQTVMLSLPADHAVSDDNALARTLSLAAEVAASGDKLVTIGVKPTSPNTGYGYIKLGKAEGKCCYKVNRFYEKPNLERATRYVESGEFLWNSGMFAWRADAILKAMEEFMPPLYAGLKRIELALGTANEQAVLEEVFQGLESVSIDFGILEHARNCYVVEAEPFGWSDVGSWDAWAQHFSPDESGNLMHGDAIRVNCSNCVVHSEKSLTAVIGAEDLIIIQSEDALLVCPRSRVQDVRSVVSELKKRGRNELI